MAGLFRYDMTQDSNRLVSADTAEERDVRTRLLLYVVNLLR
jgi:hypothetical protein